MLENYFYKNIWMDKGFFNKGFIVLKHKLFVNMLWAPVVYCWGRQLAQFSTSRSLVVIHCKYSLGIIWLRLSPVTYSLGCVIAILFVKRFFSNFLGLSKNRKKPKIPVQFDKDILQEVYPYCMFRTMQNRK